MTDTDPSETPFNGVCAYCGHRVRKVWFTGRRWICHRCWRDTFNEEPHE